MTKELDYALIHQVLAEYCFMFQEKTERRDKIVKQADLLKEKI